MNIASTFRSHQGTSIIWKEKEIPYEEFTYRVLQVVSYLKRKEDDGILVIILENSPLFLQAFCGSAYAGWIGVPLDPRLKKGEILERLNNIKPTYILCEEREREWIEEKGFCCVIRDEIKNECPSENKPVDDGPFYLGFTSGTTGNPKAFYRHHSSWSPCFSFNEDIFSIEKSNPVIIAGSLAHSLFLYAACSTLYLGGILVLMEKFIPLEVEKYFTLYPDSVFFAVPTMLESLTKSKVNHMAKKVISSGAQWDEVLQKRLRHQFLETDWYQFYGASELNFVTYMNNEDLDRRPNSIGRPFPNVSIKLIKEEEESDEGILYVNSPFLFKGYWKDEEETKKVFRNNWASVGDLARQDKDGYYYLIGRANNKVIVGGMNVFPEEIERVIMSTNQCEQAVVIGVPDEHWGEKLVAFLLPASSFNLQLLKKIIRNQLAIYKVPSYFEVVQSYPYTVSGKINRQKLKERWEEKCGKC